MSGNLYDQSIARTVELHCSIAMVSFKAWAKSGGRFGTTYSIGGVTWIVNGGAQKTT